MNVEDIRHPILIIWFHFNGRSESRPAVRDDFGIRSIVPLWLQHGACTLSWGDWDDVTDSGFDHEGNEIDWFEWDLEHNWR